MGVFSYTVVCPHYSQESQITVIHQSSEQQEDYGLKRTIEKLIKVIISLVYGIAAVEQAFTRCAWFRVMKFCFLIRQQICIAKIIFSISVFVYKV